MPEKLELVDDEPPFEAVTILFEDGMISIDDSDSFYLTVDRADQIIAWLEAWKRERQSGTTGEGR